MVVSGSVILPKLSEIGDVPSFIKRLYQKNQSNDCLDPIWVGVAVIINNGAEQYIEEKYRYAGWYSAFRNSIEAGGLDGRIGVITQYVDAEQVSQFSEVYAYTQAPWVRVSNYIHCDPLNASYDICHASSISLDARYVTTIPMSIFNQAKEVVIERDKAFVSMIESFLGESVDECE